MRIDTYMLLVFLAATTVPRAASETRLLIDFSDGRDIDSWRGVHDGVMGGLSSGRSSVKDGAARFEGRVSLDNNGGFASFRRPMSSPDLAEFDGLRLRARGDGQIYKLSLRTDDGWNAVAWQAPFATRAGEWTTIDLRFEDLVPTWRGRLVRDAGPFDPASIREIGLVIADKQEGPFTLELQKIEAWRARESSSATRAPRWPARTAGLAELIDGGADAAQLVEALRWSERLFVVATPQELDARASKQLGRLLARDADLVDRQLRTVQLMGSSGGRLAGRTLDGNQVRTLRERWGLPTSEWTLALVGKDGTVKARWSESVDVDQVFDLVDGIAMREAELKEQDR